MSSLKRGIFSYILGFVFSPLIAMFLGVPNKFSAFGVAMGLVSLLIVGGIGIAITQRKPGYVFVYCWGLISGVGTYGSFFVQ
jgi:hypothetical protein